MNCWPSLQTLLYDGWVLRFANGASKRSNSINPLHTSSIPVEEKISECERLYSSQNLKTVFKLTEESNPRALDGILEARGYEKNSMTSVQTLSISSFKPELCKSKSISIELTDSWADNYMNFAGIEPTLWASYRAIMQSIFLNRCFLSIELKDKPVCCGLGVVDGGWLGIFDIAVSPEYRGWGFGRLAVEGILEWGKDSGAETAFLQVFFVNTLAYKLYKQMGFKEAYQYWYRIKDCRL